VSRSSGARAWACSRTAAGLAQIAELAGQERAVLAQHRGLASWAHQERRQLGERRRQLGPALGLAVDRGQRDLGRRIVGGPPTGGEEGLLGLEEPAARQLEEAGGGEVGGADLGLARGGGRGAVQLGQLAALVTAAGQAELQVELAGALGRWARGGRDPRQLGGPRQIADPQLDHQGGAPELLPGGERGDQALGRATEERGLELADRARAAQVSQRGLAELEGGQAVGAGQLEGAPGVRAGGDPEARRGRQGVERGHRVGPAAGQDRDAGGGGVGEDRAEVGLDGDRPVPGEGGAEIAGCAVGVGELIARRGHGARRRGIGGQERVALLEERDPIAGARARVRALASRARSIARSRCIAGRGRSSAASTLAVSSAARAGLAEAIEQRAPGPGPGARPRRRRGGLGDHRGVGGSRQACRPASRASAVSSRSSAATSSSASPVLGRGQERERRDRARPARRARPRRDRGDRARATRDRRCARATPRRRRGARRSPAAAPWPRHQARGQRVAVGQLEVADAGVDAVGEDVGREPSPAAR
jgi:hypothetical protein